jgi:3-deoxy-manno-octulosonate cytidylyltransferase (CMP-KDO synthetase)
MIVGIIPARMGSTRFPGKPLADILGKAMIYHVYFRSKIAEKLGEVYLATCDKEIKEYCDKNNMKVVMTSSSHERCTDRTAEAMIKIEKKLKKKIKYVVMIQGDEPMVLPEMIELSIKPMLNDKSIKVVNLVAPIGSTEEENDPNQVKVVMDKDNFALYFSREPVPSRKKFDKDVKMYKQVPIITFARDFLLKFNKLLPMPLEIIESVDMLRVLEHGYEVKVVPISYDTHSVDTPRDLEKVEKLMENDKLVKKYLSK